MVSSGTYIRLGSEADCRFSCLSISETTEFGSESGTHSDEFYPEEGVPTGGVLAVTCFGLKINELPSLIAKDIFRALFVDDLAICFRGRSLDTIERHLQQAVNGIQEWATRNGFRFAAHKCKVVHFTAPRYKAQRPPTIRISNTLLPVEESTKFLGLWWDSHLSFKEHISALKTQCREALNLIRMVAHLKWGGDRDTLLMLYRTIVRSKLEYGCIVYGTASNTNLRQLDSIHNAGLRLALGAFCTSPVSSMYTEANEAPLEERRLKLSMNYYLKTRACTGNPAHHALHEFDPTTRDLYLPRPNGRGGMTRPPAKPIGLKVEEAMRSAEIDIETVCPLRTPTFPPGTHEYEPKRHSLIEGVSKCMITREEAQAKFREYLDAQGPHDEVYTDGSKIDKRVGAAAVINRHFQNGETTCRQLSKRLPNNSTTFAAEATAITLALNCYQHMDPVQHNVVIYSDSMSCLQGIEGEDTNNPLICQIMNLLWALSDKGTCVRFCWVPSHCGIEGNEVVDQLSKESLDHDIDPLMTVHFADLKPLVEGLDPNKSLTRVNRTILTKTIDGTTSESVKREWMGWALLVEVNHEAYSTNLLKLDKIGDMPVRVSAHRSLNYSKGVVRFKQAATDLTNEDMARDLNTSQQNRDIPQVREASRVIINKDGKKVQTGTFSWPSMPQLCQNMSSLGLSDLMLNSSSLLPDVASSASALAMEHVPAGRLRTCAQCAQALTTLAMNAPTRSLRSVQTVMVPTLLQARNIQHSSLTKKHSESSPKSAVHFQMPESKLVSPSQLNRQQTRMPKSQLIVKQTWLTAILLLVTRMPDLKKW